MSWTNVKLIFFRELRDQLRDRRTLFTIVVLPLLLYPLMGMSVFQVQQFLKEHTSKVRIVGTEALPEVPALLIEDKISSAWISDLESRLITLDLIEKSPDSIELQREAAREDIRKGHWHAVVLFPPDFAKAAIGRW